MAPEPAIASQLSNRDAARWFALGVSAVGVAGAFALFLVVARLPGVADIVVTDPQFAWRGLIVHVNLSLGVWFFSFLAGMFCLLPGARRFRVTPVAFWLAVAGTLAFTATAFVQSAEPIRSNYVPALDHWLFLLGIGMFGGAVTLNFADSRLLGDGQGGVLPADSHITLKAAAIAYITAMVTIFAAWATQPEGVGALAYYERLFWGGGHVLQFANVLAMVSVWLFLLATVLKRRVLHPGLAALLALLLLGPSLPGPWFAANQSPPQYFTEMMRWGIFPATSLFIVACCFTLIRARRQGWLPVGALKSTAFVGFATAVVMTVLGFILGAMIRADNTLVPAHYHMSIGAVTASFMAGMLVLLEPLGAPLRGARARRWAVWQPLVFGIGQAIFALGFAIAGLAGAERKAYGGDQVVRNAGEWAGLVTMGAGGLIASVGGVVFIVLLLAAWSGRAKHRRVVSE